MIFNREEKPIVPGEKFPKHAHCLILGNHSLNIRRLSTVSWVKAAPGNSFGTKWTWYWKNDQDQWLPYDGAHSPVSSIVQNSNEILEEHFQAGNVLFKIDWL